MWKVIGFMNGKDGNPRFPKRDLPVYGPLPRKVWVSVKGERYRKAYKGPQKAHAGNAPSSAKDYTATKAHQYAQWLATRDGHTIPDDCVVHILWSSVVVPDKPKPEPRVYAVIWDRETWDAAKREYEVTRMLTIPIPHWDWVPVCAEETFDLPLAA